ncbi:hypothetical protein [Clostridium nigeriense]|uniref:hypothetical protein n=1 Tax=Clostridium nigeriense TaxID=1805470 RepID=UPI000AE6E26B|nr:hypothetical protein [Clostridium nigeriense]
MVFKRGREKIFEEYIKYNKEKLFKIAYIYLKNKIHKALNLLRKEIEEEES